MPCKRPATTTYNALRWWWVANRSLGTSIMSLGIVTIARSCPRAFRVVREALVALLLGLIAMVVVNAILFEQSYSAAPTAANMKQDASDPAIASSFRSPLYIKGIDRSIYHFGEFQLIFYTQDEKSDVIASEVNRYRLGLPVRSLEFELYRSVHRDGSNSEKLVGAFSVHGKDVPLMPNGLEVKFPYGGFRQNPLMYLLNVVVWSAGAYVLLVVNTRMRLKIHRGRKHKRMEKQGRCVKCGYLIESLSQCPECGTNQTHRKTKHIIPDG